MWSIVQKLRCSGSRCRFETENIPSFSFGFTEAWVLIKESNCQNMSVGDAKISEKHCNFFVNKKNATSGDMKKLINFFKKKVKEKTGIELTLEIVLVE